MVSLLQEIDTEHEDMVHHAALDFYGLLLATCSSDGSVRIFHSRKNNKALAELKGHQGPVWQVAWAHPKFGNILASCSYDRKVIIWKSTTPRDWTKLWVSNYVGRVCDIHIYTHLHEHLWLWALLSTMTLVAVHTIHYIHIQTCHISDTSTATTTLRWTRLILRHLSMG